MQPDEKKVQPPASLNNIIFCRRFL